MYFRVLWFNIYLYCYVHGLLYKLLAISINSKEDLKGYKFWLIQLWQIEIAGRRIMKPSFMILQDENETIDSEKQHKRITQNISCEWCLPLTVDTIQILITAAWAANFVISDIMYNNVTS